MVTHTAQVRGRKIAWDKREVVQHGLNADRIKFDLDAEFRCCDSYQVVLCGPSLESPKRYIPDKDMTVAVPPSLMESTGPVSTCLLGYVGGEVRVVTAQERYPLVVVESGFTGPLDPGEEQLDLWAQIMSAEAARIEAELARESAEKARADAEAKRAEAEKARETASAEAVRAASDAAAKAEEAARQAESRVTVALAEVAKAEQARDEAEKARDASERARGASETARADAEGKREAAEAKRQADTARAVSDAESAASEARAAASKAEAGETAREAEEAKRVASETARKEAEDARKASEQARETAEAGRVEAETGRVTADAERGRRVDEAVRKADTATAKATEAAGKADVAATEADAAAKRADEAAKGASENVLTATKTATVVHVEDAWPTLLRELKVLGKSVQDGIPTPDAPKPIASVGKAEVVTAGKNLLDEAQLVTAAYSNSVVVIDQWHGVKQSLPFQMTRNTEGIAFRMRCARGMQLCLKYTGQANEKKVAVIVSEYASDSDFDSFSASIGTTGTTDSLSASYTCKGGGWILAFVGAKWSADEMENNVFTIEPGCIQLEVGDTPTAYAPHVPSVSTPIDLQGCEIRSLPNGVRDEVVVDREGNASLVRRVGSAAVSGVDRATYSGVSSGGAHRYIVDALKSAPGAAYVASLKNGMSDKLGYMADYSGLRPDCFYVNGSTVIFGCDRPSVAEFVEWVNALTPAILYQLAEPQTIPLGKVQPPALPESTGNVWNTDPITTDVSATYVRDVNVVIGKLEQAASAIPALAAATL